jgi:hypothetical protein
MERGSSKHSPRVDDQMAGEVSGTVTGLAGGRAEEWKMAEPSGEDQPSVDRIPDQDDPNDFSRFGRYVGRVLPGDRDAVLASAQNLEAPDDILERIRQLPPGRTFQNLKEVWDAATAQ